MHLLPSKNYLCNKNFYFLFTLILDVLDAFFQSQPALVVTPVVKSPDIVLNKYILSLIAVAISSLYIILGKLFFTVLNFLPVKTPDLSTKNKDGKESPLPIPFPEKVSRKQRRILPLQLCCPCSIGQYVVFKEKNQDNSSLVNITPGEVGKIIKKLNEWDSGLVDFSIDVPPYFQKLDTKSIADQAFNEGVIVFEEIQTQNRINPIKRVL